MENLVIFVLLIFIRKNVVVKQVAETKIVAPAPTNAQGVQGGPLGGEGGPRTPQGTHGGVPWFAMPLQVRFGEF